MIDLPPDGLQASLLRDQVANLLRAAIMSLRLKPGQELIERELVEQMGVSRATIREAVRQLAAEGLIISKPQRRATVYAPTLRETEELYEVRARLESLIVRDLAERGGPAQLRKLRSAVEELGAVVRDERPIDEMVAATQAFYSALVSGPASPIAGPIVNQLQARMQFARYTSLSVPGRPALMVQELVRIVEAIEAHDANAAESATADHIRLAAANVMTQIVEGKFEIEVAGEVKRT